MQPKKYLADQHGIDTSLIDKDAIFIITRLKEAGHLAYLVGGGVRDLLNKRKPKDFDISTSAKPEEIKKIFQRQCLLIGRRFRLAHIRMGNKIFEVATFRAGENEDELIVHDNEWGNPENDVLRRDFTINGLFYDASENCVIDYVGGWEDIQKKTLRCIGNPEVRFKQDPVRMIRLLKFRARFGFEIDVETKQALLNCRKEIIKSSAARVLEELLRMLESGYSVPFLSLMNESGLLNLLIPVLSSSLKGPLGSKVYDFLKVADKLQGKNDKHPIDRAILTSCLLFPFLENAIAKWNSEEQSHPHIGDIMVMTSSMIKEVIASAFSHFPKRISTLMIFILSMQYRLTPLSGKRHFKPKLMQNKEFDLALHFLKIRAILDEKLTEDYFAWKRLYEQHYGHADRLSQRRTKHRRKR